MKNDKYINMGYASIEGIFRTEQSGLNNPNFNNKWTDEQKRKASDKRAIEEWENTTGLKS